nr:NUDIX hydrolase [uncultured Flavobacterium sp.]
MRVSKIFVTVDIVLFKAENQILLIKRKNDPFKDCWALPGGFVDENEDLEVAALRELEEETTIKLEKLSQLGAYGKPFRDPRSHVVSIAYFANVDKNIIAKAADDAKEAKWFTVTNLPELAFDHAEIIKDAIAKSK